MSRLDSERDRKAVLDSLLNFEFVVPFKRIGECCSVEKGNTPIQKAIPGQYPLVATTEERQTSATYQFDAQAVCVPLISSRGHGVASISRIYYQEGKFALGNILCAIIPNDSTVLSAKFLRYYLYRAKDWLLVPLMRGGANVSLTIDSLKKVKIPIPPLEIQNEIVRILDTFMELTAELTVELDARKRQYEYYRDSFFGENYSDMLRLADTGKFSLSKLSDVGTFTRGKRFVRDDLVSDGTPCIHYGDLYTYYGIWADKTKDCLVPEVAEKLRFAHNGDVVIVGAGENNEDIGIGVAWFGNEDAAVHDACYIFKHNMNPKYISYYLRSHTYHMQIKKHVVRGKICAISATDIGKALIPIYSLDEQERIVSILDRFDKLCSDISAGIPAEIEARRKQYEHYRDRLLTFKEKTA